MRAPLLVVGEVRTALLMNSAPLTPPGAGALLDLVEGARVRSAERPVPRAVSADLVHPVDCPLSTGSGTKTRGTGTILARARVTAGRVLQASARATLVAGGPRRPDWARHLERLGTVEASGRATADDLAAGFPGTDAPGPTLDPGAACEQLLARVQGASSLDRLPAFRARRTRLRWSAAFGDGDRPGGVFTLHDATRRTLHLRLPSPTFADAAEIAALCEDLALHDWLLTVVADVAERACAGPADPASLRRLRPAVDHLLHVWMPGLDVAPALLAVWDDLEAAPGLTRQWRSSVDRIRDHMALNTLELLSRPPVPSVPYRRRVSPDHRGPHSPPPDARLGGAAPNGVSPVCGA
ncbi:SCO2521 family protein [Yinghuangia sp. ASG 101]|uniref:SCO2521 family protein n=1 Tax=Yinghuangia sp. ASG 101 TaxID=2896848 RepID=UPI001E5854AC|nr:SCO2521 family protein [Yinghuangia sp. ASG 101]UGQ10812.1 SCO2521 family protein [Yinghuangia sp. ASG 101]